ncbi:amidase [Paraglaciecola psychrophila]|uniref:Amidase family protein n=1 Tax=Paraglaciecola psychrophila 170 TaxID=1129794 RepID=K6YV33_9ALTE|nr:amidase [Paraglaciecola psychrophila]AGH42860.1 amidase family protein [Paraglaciecola psychrophila 170]GAC36574.1 aspartyl-tRNA(Asn)/glutamyl-tRNA (Gln) amidotransferase subunit A [Paraglaciecola psychrophila 170]
MKHLLLCAIAAGISISGCTPTTENSEVTQPVLVETDFRATGILAGSLPDVIEALESNQISSQDLVTLYLERIQKIDKNGPKLQSIIALNPDALTIAKQLDQMRAAGEIMGPLHGVPVLLKDNIETKDLIATTAGAFALKDNITGRDSPLVAGLRAQGAIILGKTNLSQWANFRSEGSMSGWSALGGQVRNPHMLDRNPCGSSSGSGAATAASLAAASVGTETNGSIICPSNANGIVGFKPTVGIVPQQYIIPISESQDTAGPMTKTVMGAALMMNAMATTTPDTDYSAGLTKDALKGVRVGVLNFAKGESMPILEHFKTALMDLEAAGAILVDIDKRPETPKDFGKMGYDILKYEFKHGLNAYLASTSAEQVTPRTLEELIAFNEAHSNIELALFDQSIFVASQSMDSLDSEAYKTAIETVQKSTRQEGIDTLLQEFEVQVLIAPSGPTVPRVDPINGDVWPSSWPGFGGHAAQAGYPHATVPMGGIHGISVGLSFIGGKNTDAEILSYAYGYEQHSLRRLEPQYHKDAEALPFIADAIKPYSEAK